jgi:hypothetical protein
MVNIALGNVSVSACPGVAHWCNDGDLGVAINCIIEAVNNALDGCGVPRPTPPPPTPVLHHGHTCCECTDAACMDFAWVEVERTCPLGCQTFMDAECEAPCHGGPVGTPTTCVGLTACTTDADCDDGNGCSMDRCTLDGCTHVCVCD